MATLSIAPPRAKGMALKDPRERVLSLAESLIIDHARNPQQRRLLLSALHGLRKQLTDQESPPFVFLPLLVYEAISGTREPAFPLSAAMTLLFLGIDIHDDLADGDLPAHWKPFHPAEIHLAAATLLSSLPQLALSELNTGPECSAAMHRSLACGLLRMSAGQQTDLALAGRTNVSAEEVEASVESKSGEELALFATLAAQLAQAPPSIAQAYATMGRAFGTGGQLSSDCFDLFHAKWSRDLANGTRTFPIALHLERLKGGKRGHFLRLLERAKKSASAQGEVRRCLREAGELRRCAVIVEIYCQKALSALKAANPKEPAGAHLRDLIEFNSLFRKKK